MSILSLLKELKKMSDEAPPLPRAGLPPYWVREDNFIEPDDPREEYDKDHFFSVKDQCWVRLENGVFFRSIPFEEWDLDEDADNSHDVVYPERLLTREEYEDADDFPDSYYAR